MEWFWIVVGAGVVWFAAKWWRARVSTIHARAQELEGVRRLVDEDAAHLGECLQGLDREIGGRSLDEQARAAHQTAVDSFESASRSATQISRLDEVTRVAETIAAGRHAVASVEARLAGRPAPEQRVMCFFDPKHGPSVADVQWTRPGHGPRRVPACAEDAARVLDKLAPEVRTVNVGTRALPYWVAGSSFRSYAKGYFVTDAALSWACEPPAADAAAGTAGPGYFGTGTVGGSGHFDGGGFDGSGAGG